MEIRSASPYLVWVAPYLALLVYDVDRYCVLLKSDVFGLIAMPAMSWNTEQGRNKDSLVIFWTLSSIFFVKVLEPIWMR